MTKPAQPVDDDDDMPVHQAAISGLQRPAQPSAAVRQAYWYGTRLIRHGWIIRCVGANEQGGFFVAETPRGRAVTVGPGHHRRSTVELAQQFADSITVLAGCSRTDGHNRVRELLMLLSAHAVRRRAPERQWRTWHIPGVALCQQPTARVRAAYWFAASLTDDYGWELSEIGSPAAGGGFLADIPGEVTAIYPGDMRDDGTAEIRALGPLLERHSAERRHRRGYPTESR